jgi:hypothetical protein
VQRELVGEVATPSATRSRALWDTGQQGSSLISEPGTMGSHSSRRPTSERIMRRLACRLSPRKITS